MDEEINTKININTEENEKEERRIKAISGPGGC